MNNSLAESPISTPGWVGPGLYYIQNALGLWDRRVLVFDRAALVAYLQASGDTRTEVPLFLEFLDDVLDSTQSSEDQCPPWASPQQWVRSLVDEELAGVDVLV